MYQSQRSLLHYNGSLWEDWPFRHLGWTVGRKKFTAEPGRLVGKATDHLVTAEQTDSRTTTRKSAKLAEVEIL